MTGVLVVLAWVVLATLAALIGAEVIGGFAVLSRAVVRAAARRLPRDRDRWGEEWLDHLGAMDQRPLSALWYAAKIYRDAGRMCAVMAPSVGLTVVARAIKRGVDLALAAVGILILAPLMVAIALIIRLTSRGPAVFTQVRAGRDGKPFKILKFRTMCHDAEQRIGEVISPDELTEPMFKLRKDPRVTKVGRFLRRASLDELPQLFNVLRGDMSLVGPRPEELWLVERYGETQRFRLQMRPGLTGPMQVHGRGELNVRERLAVEREYVENWTLRRELRILLRTVVEVLKAPPRF